MATPLGARDQKRSHLSAGRVSRWQSCHVTTGVELRLAEAAAVEGLRRVAEAAWHESHAPIVGASAVASFIEAYYDDEAFEALIEDDAALLAVAADGGVVGFISAQPDDGTDGTYQLGRLYVAPDRWGEGVGGRFLDHAERMVRERGGERLSLGVMVENDRARGFYEGAGYRWVDTCHDDRLGAEGYTYAKEL